jgi:hypothetical protein
MARCLLKAVLSPLLYIKGREGVTGERKRRKGKESSRGCVFLFFVWVLLTL